MKPMTLVKVVPEADPRVPLDNPGQFCSTGSSFGQEMALEPDIDVETVSDVRTFLRTHLLEKPGAHLEHAHWKLGNWVLHVSWSPDGHTVATASLDCTCRIYDLDTKQEVANWPLLLTTTPAAFMTWTPSG